MSKRTPENFLKQVNGRNVMIKLYSGIEYTGTLACMDALMNVVLDNAEERLNGEVVNSFGNLFLRGNNGIFVRFSALYQIETKGNLTFYFNHYIYILFRTKGN